MRRNMIPDEPEAPQPETRATWIRSVSSAAVVLAALAAPVEAQPAFNVMNGIVIGAHAADLLTTVQALERPGVREGNPIMRPFAANSASLTLAKASGAALSAWAKHEVYKSNPKLAWVLAIGEAAVIGVVAWRNHHAGR